MTLNLLYVSTNQTNRMFFQYLLLEIEAKVVIKITIV